MQSTRTLADYLDLVKRRKSCIVVTWLLVSIIALIVAYKLPKVYRSTATMLIEAPIPTNLLESTVSQFADEQIQSIYQKVMTTDNVLSIIDSAGLYSDTKKDSMKTELAKLFKKNAEVKLSTSTVTPDIQSGKAEIAFEISFSDGEATTAQKIASKLATLFIEQNDKDRTQRAIKATNFLMEESDKLNLELQGIDSKIAKYKEQHNFSLPEQMKGNLEAIDRMESELRDTDNHIRTTKEMIAFLGAELARARQELPGNLESKVPQSRDEALRILRMKYLQLSSSYYPGHPAMVRLKGEIQALDPTFDGQLVEEDLFKQLAEARRGLKLLEETPAGKQADIVKQRKQIEKLEQNLKNVQADSQREQEAAVHVTNPTYLAVETQYKNSQSELQSLMEKQVFLKAKLEKMHDIVLQAPHVEMAYTDLIRERDNAIKKYTQIKEKWLDAKLVRTLEQEQQGQTLVMIDQPIVPSQPEKKTRRIVAIGGFFMGLLAGLGAAFFIEFMEPGIRGYRAVAEVTGLIPLIVIPYIESPSELEARIVKEGQIKKIMGWTGAALILLTTVATCTFYLPLVQT